MNEDDLDLLVASASPISDQRVAGIPLAGSETELSEAIMSIPVLDDVVVAPRREHPHRPRRRAIAPVAALVALLVGVVGFQQLDRDDGSAWAAPIVAVANAAPRILVGRPGWTVSRADEFTAAQGEMTFSDGLHQIDLHWRPAGTVEDRSAEVTELSSLKVAGRDARMFRYNGPVGPTEGAAAVTAAVAPPVPTAPAGGPGDFTTLWTQGAHSVEVRGVFDDAEAYKEVLAGLREVDVDTWLRAMPASVVRPASRTAVVDEMLADLTLPEGFDRAALTTGTRVQDRYQLGAVVTGRVACTWIDRWIAAGDVGDAAAAKQAVDAMATSHHWRVLVEMRDQGAYSSVVWELADAMATDAPVSGGKPLTIRESYVESLGCTTR